MTLTIDPQPLNSIFLKNRIIELGLKQWWLAEQIGVDRKTVNRWLRGQVKSIQKENLIALSKVLDCETRELTLTDHQSHTANSEDQKTAAELITASSLMEKLGPVGEWNVIESLLKSTLVPELPLYVLGELYSQLTIVSWRQSKIPQVEIYNKKTKEIASKLNDKALIAKALLSEANIFSWRGECRKSIECSKSIFSLERFIGPKLMGSTHSNLGGLLYEMGEIDLGLFHVDKSIFYFLIDGTALNLSISHCHLAIIGLHKNDLQMAEAHAVKSQDLALAIDFRRGVYMANLILANVQAAKGLISDSVMNLYKGIEGFKSLKVEEGLNYEFAGRICRLNGKLEESLTYLNKGVGVSNEFPLYQAAVYLELALTQQKLQLDHRNSIQQSLRLFDKCEATTKVDFIKSMSLDVP